MKQSSYQLGSPRSRRRKSSRPSRAQLAVAVMAMMALIVVGFGVGICLLVGGSTPTGKNTSHQINPIPSLRSLRNETAIVKPAAKTPPTVPHHDATSSSPIPHTLFFTYKHNILETKEPSVFYENVMHTINEYRALWNEPDATVVFLNDDDCIREITTAEPRLVEHFNKTRAGSWKADICRIAALYNHGGYYFDIDIKVVQPVDLSKQPEVDFVTIHETATYMNFFQAFIASTRQHFILKEALENMLKCMDGRMKVSGNLGPYTLKLAFKASSRDQRIHKSWILHELNLDHPKHPPERYSDFARQVGDGCCCNFAVEDEKQGKIYFYSRVVGASSRCKLPTSAETNR